MTFPDNYSDSQCVNYINEIFAPYINELENTCKAMVAAIQHGSKCEEIHIHQLMGKISNLQGILKGIELSIRKNDL